MIYQMNLPFLLIDINIGFGICCFIDFSAIAVDISDELAFPVNRLATFVFVKNIRVDITPVKNEVDVISKYIPFNLFAATTTLPPPISLAAPMFLAPSISQVFY